MVKFKRNKSIIFCLLSLGLYVYFHSKKTHFAFSFQIALRTIGVYVYVGRRVNDTTHTDDIEECSFPFFPPVPHARNAPPKVRSSSNELMASEFKGVTGASDAIANAFVRRFNGNVNAAVMAYFDNPTPGWLRGNDGGVKPVCRYFRNGYCRDGAFCTFSHNLSGATDRNNNNNGGVDTAMQAALAASRQTAQQRGAAGKKPTIVRTRTVGGGAINVCHGDLSVDDSDVVVNAANKMLDHAGGLAAILVRKGGPKIQEESFRYVKDHGVTNQWGRLYLKDASVAATTSGTLPCKRLFHAIGPVWNGGPKTKANAQAAVFRDTIRNCLSRAEKENMTSISIPAISTGKFGFPKELCAQISLETAYAFLSKRSDACSLRVVNFTNFDRDTVDVFTNTFDRLEKKIVAGKQDDDDDDAASKTSDHANNDSAHRWISLPGKSGLWREVRPNEALPAGSEVSMNFSTGKNYVKKTNDRQPLVIGGIDTTGMDDDTIAALRIAYQNDVVASSASVGKTSSLRLRYPIDDERCIDVCHGDLTVATVDAIVNAANKRLQHAGALAGAIVRKGGQVIQDESDRWLAAHGTLDASCGANVLPVSGVAVTSGGKLTATFILHAVGPSWDGGDVNDRQNPRAVLLRRTVQNCLKQAHELKTVASIAMPAISTGAFGFPKRLCAEIMIECAEEFFQKFPESKLKSIVLMNFDKVTVDIFETCLKNAIAASSAAVSTGVGDEERAPSASTAMVVVEDNDETSTKTISE